MLLASSLLLAGADKPLQNIIRDLDKIRKETIEIQDTYRPFSTAFQYWKDLPGPNGKKPDGKIDFDELMGWNDKFTLSEENIIRFASQIKDHKRDKIYFSLLDPEGRTLEEETYISQHQDEVHWFGYHASDLLKKIEAEGTFTALWEFSKPNSLEEREIFDIYTVEFKR